MQDASDEPPSSPQPPSVHDRITRKLPEDAMNEAAAGLPRCPRCGGQAAPRRRAPNRFNPFLRSAPPSGQITCDDCGLEFEHATESSKAPWSTKDS
jgi:hypothetical protein